MKNFKIISLGIAMLISFVAIVQEKTVHPICVKSINTNKNKISFYLNGTKVSSDSMSKIKSENISEVKIIKGIKKFFKYGALKRIVVTVKTKNSSVKK